MCYRLIFRTLLFFVISSNLTFGKSEINYVSSSNERPKKPVCDFKAGLARLWHGALQREREITLHTWSTKKKKKSLWNGLLGGIQSGTSRGIDGTAPGRWDTWPGQDACWAPYQWALAHPRGAPKPCRLKNPRAWQHIWACHALSFHSGVMLSPSVTGAAVSVELTEMMQLHKEKKKKKRKIKTNK